jgi:restriction endonuclease Mrr
VKTCTAEFFERLVVQLLVAMGYGGSLADAGQAVGWSGDEGIDGIIKEEKLGLDLVCIQAKRWKNPVGRPMVQANGVIKEDKLGLDVVCIQAKRWKNPVGRSMVQAFAGSMEGYRARKGA